jgi:hypothetical protein
MSTGHDDIGGGQILHSASLREHLSKPAHHAEADSATQDVDVAVLCAVVHEAVMAHMQLRSAGLFR